ncbi:2-oxoglutarate oxidoreductase [Spirochaetes bacterium]|uniref:2-oxoglutarate oxidoreductase n=1 Tax=Candidatus Scatousia excrementipullorum TaxID=2840936 RepID=A0A9D9DUP5_9BACT|nr:2-oxoglutarate oxidoreductase [Candidatus Scatousia excrementipullorum]
MAVQTFKLPESIREGAKFSFCPGCDHGVAIRLVAEVLDELGLRENTITATSIGCSVTLYDFLDVDAVEAPHGRALAEATGIKRARPDKCVFTYQGDGDFASIGLAESLHAALRGENVTAICINNTTYGMTGGQLGPTTLLGQKTTTSPTGRNVEYYGYPIKIAEHVALCDGTAYSARVSLDTVANIRKAKQAIKKAFEIQMQGLGFTFVEILSTCPTNWKMTPQQAHERVRTQMMEVFKPGVYKDITSEKAV